MSASRPAWMVGSSSIRRASASPILSSSPFDLGSMANEIAASGNSIQSRRIGSSLLASVSPV